jgi:NAD(P)-dependent dehydrogenase (short-subunit alcohol dehydrogenase family)
MSDLQFSGDVAWVTGSSKGIGRAISIGLAEQGCHVVVHYNSSEDEHTLRAISRPSARKLMADRALFRKSF